MAKTVNAKIVIRNNTASNFATNNPILLKGEMGIEIDTGKFKFGDGVTAWNTLAYPPTGNLIQMTRDANGADWNYPVGSIWLNITNGRTFIIRGSAPGVGVWHRFVDSAELSNFGDMFKSTFATLDSANGYVDKAKVADKLKTARKINGVDFNGTEDITIEDSTKEPFITGDVVTKFWSGTKTWRDLAIDVRAVVLTGLSTASATAISVADTILSALGKLQAQITAHTAKIDNPHSVTKSQVGLGNVDNTADSTKSVLSASKLTTPRNIAITGDGSASVNFDGTGNVSLAMVLANVVTAGTGCKLTVNAKGLVTGIEALSASDIPMLTSAKIGDLGNAALKNVGSSIGNVVIVGSDGKIDGSLMPAIAITDTFIVGSQAEMLALTAEKGDVCIRTDQNMTYILKASPTSTLGNWVELKTPTDAVLSVNGQTGAITLTTSHIAEGTNLYWTTARGTTLFNSLFAGKSVTGLSDGANVLLDTDTIILDGGN